MSHFDSNPFDEDASRNPFADASAAGQGRSQRAAPPPAVSGSGTAAFFDKVAAPNGAAGGAGSSRDGDPALPSLRMAPLPPESRSGSAFDAARDIPFSPKTLRKKQKELQQREAQLRQKEKELESREENLGVSRPNWPPFFPIIRHNIQEDIPEYLQAMQRRVFFSWLGCIFCLTYNFLAVLVCWIMGALSFVGGVFCFFMALILLLLGVPLSFYFWYRRLYNSLKNDSTFGLVLFFVSYTSHLMWFTIFAIAPPIFFGGYYMCGVLTFLGMFANGSVVGGILYIIGCAFFVGEVTLSSFVMVQVFGYFRSSKKQDQLKREAAMAALRNSV